MPSSVAGIIDAGGGLRVVVTEHWRMAAHVGRGERLFVVPGLLVEEPVPREDVPNLIDVVQRYIRETTL